MRHCGPSRQPPTPGRFRSHPTVDTSPTMTQDTHHLGDTKDVPPAIWFTSKMQVNVLRLRQLKLECGQTVGLCRSPNKLQQRPHGGPSLATRRPHCTAPAQHPSLPPRGPELCCPGTQHLGNSWTDGHSSHLSVLSNLLFSGAQRQKTMAGRRKDLRGQLGILT